MENKFYYPLRTKGDDFFFFFFFFLVLVIWVPHVKLASLQSRPQALKLEKTIKNICGGKKEERKSITSYNFTIMVGQYLSDVSVLN